MKKRLLSGILASSMILSLHMVSAATETQVPLDETLNENSDIILDSTLEENTEVTEDTQEVTAEEKASFRDKFFRENAIFMKSTDVSAEVLHRISVEMEEFDRPFAEVFIPAIDQDLEGIFVYCNLFNEYLLEIADEDFTEEVMLATVDPYILEHFSDYEARETFIHFYYGGSDAEFQERLESDGNFKGIIDELNSYSVADLTNVDESFAKIIYHYDAEGVGSFENIPFDGETDLEDLVISEWALPFYEEAAERGLLVDSFSKNLTKDINRAQIAHILVNLVEVYTGEDRVPTTTTFPDTDNEAVLKAYGAGIVSGRDDGSFDPNASATREEIAIMMLKTVNLLEAAAGKVIATPTETIDGYTDFESVSDWAKTAMATLVESGLMAGISTTELGPLGNTTMEQCIALVNTLYGK